MKNQSQHINTKTTNDIITIAKSMADYFGVSDGCISMRVRHNTFLINRRLGMFSDISPDSMILLNTQLEARWNEASSQCSICAGIYSYFKDAKFVLFAKNPYGNVQSILHDNIHIKDAIGYELLGESIAVLDSKDLDTWEERKSAEVLHYFKTSNKPFVVVRGGGMYAYGRDLFEVARYIATFEESAKTLTHLESNGK